MGLNESVNFVKRRRNEKGKKIRKQYETKNIKATMKEIRDWVIVPQKVSNTLSGVGIDNLLVFGQTTMTDGRPLSTATITETSAKPISEQLTLMPYQNTTSSVRDFLARISQLLGSGQELRALEAHYSLRYAESYGLRDLAMYSLRMSRVSSQQTTERPFIPSSDAWMNWGMTANGKCLTARIGESLKTGSVCSLSDILEDSVDQKYFLSERTLKGLMKGQAKPQLLELCKAEDIREDTIQK